MRSSCTGERSAPIRRTPPVTTTSGGRWPSAVRSIARFRAITGRSSCRPKMPTRIRAWRARSSCRISSPKRSIAIAARSKSSPIAWARCSIWRGLSRRRRIVELRVPAEGVRLAERAVRLTNGTNATALDTLAAAYAAAGQTDRAVATAETCVEDCDGQRRTGARRRDTRAARSLPRQRRRSDYECSEP